MPSPLPVVALASVKAAGKGFTVTALAATVVAQKGDDALVPVTL
ncbi:MAG: hypothetical protein NTZ59_11405 [Bacteroidetes bacterium]|nr:hypothetical protein [Bacteroidota bacterium]